MHARTWLDSGDRFPPGGELFRSDRDFTVWAYTVSHSQLLLRTRTHADRSRIDIVFKPVEAVKLRTEYHGLVIRCATREESDRIGSETGGVPPGARCLILETAGEQGHQDYVVTYAVGWEEDLETDRDPSKLAGFAPASDPDRILG
ncbi:hypothetical protein ACFYY8_26150 [Streptosporangium sp. NPDC001559]|uniref:hypothetical protein n=1 Tax=Streptosporangium sp. NPDC001559 TaxID=3366187 RepID=UPI0036E24D44